MALSVLNEVARAQGGFLVAQQKRVLAHMLTTTFYDEHEILSANSVPTPIFRARLTAQFGPFATETFTFDVNHSRRYHTMPQVHIESIYKPRLDTSSMLDRN